MFKLLTNIVSLMFVSMVTPEAGAKHEFLSNKPALSFQLKVFISTGMALKLK
jgi:hypothetical protein